MLGEIRVFSFHFQGGDRVGDAETAKIQADKVHGERFLLRQRLRRFSVAFVQSLCHTKGTWARKPFELIDWREQIIRDIFGILKPNGCRQFNTTYIEMPKEQGKSELATAIALLLTCGDGEECAEVYGCAADRNQATIAFDVAVDMVRFCSALSKRVKILESQKKSSTCLHKVPARCSLRTLRTSTASTHTA